MNNKRYLTIGSLAKELGICKETIRYYHRIGLLPVPAHLPNGAVRAYRDEHLQLLQFIKRAQRLGFSLDEIRSLIELSNGSCCHQVQAFAKRKLADLEQKMAEIAYMRNAIRALLNECVDNKREAQCPIIEALLHDASMIAVSQNADNRAH